MIINGNKKTIYSRRNKFDRKKDTTRGITLIALIITVIVMLILTGIVMALTIGENNIFRKAEEAGKNYSEKEAREKLELVLLDLQVDKQVNKQYNENEYINKRIVDEGMQVNENIVTVDKWQFEIDRSVPEIKNDLGQNVDKEEIEGNLILGYNMKKIMSKRIPVTLKDNSGKSVDANLVDAVYNEERTGILFNGESTYSQLDSSKLNITFPATITMAVKWENINNQLIFIDTNSKIGIGTYNGEILLSAIDRSQYYKLPSNFTTNKINYITVLYRTSATDNEIYINGEKLTKATTTPSAWALSESGTYLGRRRSGSYFKGILYDFKIYNKEFTQEEVIQKYQLDRGFFENNHIEGEINNENLILDYTVKNNSNNVEKEIPGTLEDLTGNSVNAILQDAEYNEDRTGIVFNGTSTYSQIDSSKLNITFPTTITIAAKWEENTSQDDIIFIDNNSKIGIGTWLSQYMILEIKGAPVLYYDLPLDFYTKEINYITVVYSSIEDYQLYINGTKIEGKLTTGNGWNKNDTGTYLGRRNTEGYFKGILYQFKIYDKLFSEEEIIENYYKDKEYFEGN